MNSPITTHVLDTSSGRPAAGIPVRLERQNGERWEDVGRGITDDDGRVSDLVKGSIDPGVYRLTFDSGDYFREYAHFYPIIRIEFYYEVDGRHHHVPLLLSPFGYSTYRGS